jgi:bifunctional DNA-binding transcriptional regulator/antitoxin component of YhaV-PrlF toxin-antitoxin module
LERQKLPSFWIALDKKGRLVLPLEIRQALGIQTNGKILLSVSDVGDGKVIAEIAKAPEDTEGISYSKNGKYIKGQVSQTLCAYRERQIVCECDQERSVVLDIVMRTEGSKLQYNKK